MWPNFCSSNQYGKLKFSIFIFQYTQTVSGHTVNQTLGKTKRGSIAPLENVD